MIEETDLLSPSIAWPPQHTVRVSLKARRPFLQISPERGLEVVLPQRKRKFPVLDLLNEKRTWIEKMLKKILSTSRYLDEKSLPNDPRKLPETVHCPVLGEAWSIQYQFHVTSMIRLKLTESSHSSAVSAQRTLTLKGNTNNFSLVRKTLIRWLTQRAHQLLIPWLNRLSVEMKLPFSKVIIRGQNTLWGSCTAKKSISLNYKLLFLPEELVRHVLVHELCHTKYLNHSARFWNFFKTWDPNLEVNRNALKNANRYVPDWVNLKDVPIIDIA